MTLLRWTRAPRARGLSCALVLVLCSCGEEPAPAAWGVQRLDFRLPGGRPYHERLAAEDRVQQSWRPTPDARMEEVLGPWRPRNVLGRVDEDAALSVRAADYAPDRGVDHAWWVLPGPLQASDWDALEVAGSWNAGSEAVLFWIREGEAEPHRLGMPVDPTTDVVRFDLSTDPAWSGSIEEVRLFPLGGGPQSYRLREIRALRAGFRPGADPSTAFGEPRADAGLLGFGGDQRRTIVSGLGSVLEASFRAPGGARLVLDVGAPRGLGGAALWKLHAVVQRSTGESLIQFEKLVPLTAESDVGWARIDEPLPDAPAGEDLRLTLEIRGEGGVPGTPVWLGAPHVVGAREPGGRPDVLLVTLDTLRADALGTKLDGVSITPRLDRFGESALVFTDAWSACNSTLPSHASILTGLPVPTHGVEDNRSRLASGVRTLAQEFAAAGYRTAAAVSVHHLQPAYSGLGRGFDQYHLVRRGAVVDGGLTLEPVMEWLEDEREEAPLFLWVHLFDPHTPYTPPPAFLQEYEREHPAPPRTTDASSIAPNHYTKASGFLEGVNHLPYAEHLYRAGVAYTDRLFGRLLDAFDRRREGGVVAVTSDHGEALGERGIWFNHLLCYPEVLQVPLMLRFPGHAPRRVVARASTLDLAPTFLERLDLGAGARPPGISLLDVAAGRSGQDRQVQFVHSALLQAGCRADEVHYVLTLQPWNLLGEESALSTGHEVLYDPSVDPSLSQDLAPEGGPRLRRYREVMQAWLEGAATGTRVGARVSRGEELQLQALGYGGEEGSSLPEQGSDQ